MSHELPERNGTLEAMLAERTPGKSRLLQKLLLDCKDLSVEYPRSVGSIVTNKHDRD